MNARSKVGSGVAGAFSIFPWLGMQAQHIAAVEIGIIPAAGAADRENNLQ